MTRSSTTSTSTAKPSATVPSKPPSWLSAEPEDYLDRMDEIASMVFWTEYWLLQSELVQRQAEDVQRALEEDSEWQETKSSTSS